MRPQDIDVREPEPTEADFGTIEVPSRLRLDEQRLSAFLAKHVAGSKPPFSIRMFKGGNSNPTYLVRDADGRAYVLRKKPPSGVAGSAHQVEREYRIMKALGTTAVPVPRMRALCEDEGVIGTAFYVMDHVEGRIFRDPALPGMRPAERSAVFDAMNDTLARLHSVDVAAAGIADYGRPGNYFERQFDRWQKQYRLNETDRIEEMEALLAALPARIPPSSAVAIAHGDFRMENMIFHPSEPRVIAVLDWELSTLGDPLADLGYNCLMYNVDSRTVGTVRGLDFEAAGIPTQADYVDAYCRRTGRRAIADFGFYVSFALFRLAAISQGRAKRRLAGVTQREPGPGNECVDFARLALPILNS